MVDHHTLGIFPVKSGSFGDVHVNTSDLYLPVRLGFYPSITIYIVDEKGKSCSFENKQPTFILELN
jgi:hypothetical protein